MKKICVVEGFRANVLKPGVNVIDYEGLFVLL